MALASRRLERRPDLPGRHRFPAVLQSNGRSAGLAARPRPRRFRRQDRTPSGRAPGIPAELEFRWAVPSARREAAFAVRSAQRRREVREAYRAAYRRQPDPRELDLRFEATPRSRAVEHEVRRAGPDAASL